MPYASDKQRRYMHARLPKIAKKWDEEIRKEKAAKRRKRKRHPLVKGFLRNFGG
jgi:hypothetical protein